MKVRATERRQVSRERAKTMLPNRCPVNLQIVGTRFSQWLTSSKTFKNARSLAGTEDRTADAPRRLAHLGLLFCHRPSSRLFCHHHPPFACRHHAVRLPSRRTHGKGAP